MKFNQVVSNFTSGKWSEQMLTNTDTEEYKKACKTLTNMIIQKNGGAFKKPGTSYIDVGGSAQTILNNATSFEVFPIIGTDGSGDPAQYFLITSRNNPATDWLYYDQASGVCQAVTASWTQAEDLRGASYAQVGNLVYITSTTGLYRPWVVEVDLGVCYVSDWISASFHNPLPFYPPNSLGRGTPATITSSAATGATTLTASAAFFTSALYDGGFIKLTAAGVTGIIKITAGSGGSPTTTCTGTVIIGTAPLVACGTASGTSWEITAWNGMYGWPTKVCGHEQRLYFSGKPSIDGNVVYGSRAGVVDDFMEIPLAQDPLFTTYASDNARPFSFAPTSGTGSIQLLASSKVLIVGFIDKELIVKSNAGLGPLDIAIESSSSYGMAAINPVGVGNNILYSQSNFKAVRKLEFSNQNENYNSIDMTTVEDISEGGKYKIYKMVSTFIGDTQVVVVLLKSALLGLSDTKVSVLSIDENNKLAAWSNFEIRSGDIIEGLVSTSNLPGVPGKLFFITRRSVNSTDKLYIEEFKDIYLKSTYGVVAADTFYYLDCCRVVLSPGSATISAPHLTGELVHVFGDYNYIGSYTISGAGNLVLDAVYSHIVFGIAYTAKIIPASFQVNTNVGISTGQAKKATTLYIKFLNTIEAYYGCPTKSEYYQIMFRDSSVVASTSIPLFNGFKRVHAPQGFERELLVELKSEGPFPFNVLSLAVDGVTYA